MSLKKSLLVLAAMASTAAFAQTATPAIPVPTCVKPDLPAGDKSLTRDEAERLNSASKAYQTCVTAYHDARKAAMDKYNALAIENNAAAVAQANAARKLDEEFKAYADAFNAASAVRAAKQNRD